MAKKAKPLDDAVMSELTLRNPREGKFELEMLIGAQVYGFAEIRSALTMLVLTPEGPGTPCADEYEDRFFTLRKTGDLVTDPVADHYVGHAEVGGTVWHLWEGSH